MQGVMVKKPLDTAYGSARLFHLSIQEACSVCHTVRLPCPRIVQPLPLARTITAVGNGPPFSHSRERSMASTIEMGATR